MSIFVDIEKTLGNFRLKVAFEAGNETLALLGASGSGKSMTLKCIAGIEKPDRGGSWWTMWCCSIRKSTSISPLSSGTRG